MVTRNQLCPCGSGLRYKHCHGRPAVPPPDAEERIEAAFRQMAVDRLQQRRLQRSGRPIVSWTDRSGRYVAVHRRVFCGPWKTFVDFLGHYISRVLGSDWGNAELAKPRPVRHPLLNWYHDYRTLQSNRPQTPGELHPAAPAGVAAAYLGLAYDLYTLEHDGDRLAGPDVRERLIARLKRADRFVVARHEVRVAAMLLRAGYALQWDAANADDPHGAITATHAHSKRAFRVECRIRPPVAAAPDADGGRVVELVRDALRTPAGLPRLVFLDVDAAAAPDVDWRVWAVGALRAYEAEPANADLPAAYLLITNYPDHHDPGQPVPDGAVVLEGFRIDDLRHGAATALADLLAARRAHPDVHDLRTSIREHMVLPSRFDADAPGAEALPDRPRIGAPHTVDGHAGVVVSAVVKEPAPLAVLLLAFDDGRRRFFEVPLSEHEMAAWRRYPETFFGDLRLPPPDCRDVLDCYEFFEDAYRDQPREQLLAWMARWPQPERRRHMTQPQLLEQWCCGLAERAIARPGM